MSKYLAKRSEVCAGILTLPWSILDYYEYVEGTTITKEELENLSYSYLRAISKINIRSMLFSVDHNGCSRDLIYSTPFCYQIVGQPQIKYTYKKLQINNYVELDQLLRFLNFGEDLTAEDLLKIYSMLIIHKSWLYDHLEVFGWKKTEYGFIYSGGTSTVSMDVFNELNKISAINNGKPKYFEPGFARIKRIV